MKRLYSIIVVLVFLAFVAYPCHADDDFDDFSYSQIPNLVGAEWVGTVDRVGFFGFELDQPFNMTIVGQEEHLFYAEILRPGSLPVPLFGVFINRHKIRISTGQTVLFARLSGSLTKIRGYYFSTDPLEEAPERGWKQNEHPHMGTFTLYRQ